MGEEVDEEGESTGPRAVIMTIVVIDILGRILHNCADEMFTLFHVMSLA